MASKTKQTIKTFSFSPIIADMLKDFAKERKRPQSGVTEQALREYLKLNWKSEKEYLKKEG